MLSCGDDGTVRAWAMRGPPSGWRCVVCVNARVSAKMRVCVCERVRAHVKE